jgi:hypothetical protein
MGEERNAKFVRKTYAWENNIQMDLKETGCEGVNWNHCI